MKIREKKIIEIFYHDNENIFLHLYSNKRLSFNFQVKRNSKF